MYFNPSYMIPSDSCHIPVGGAKSVSGASERVCLSPTLRGAQNLPTLQSWHALHCRTRLD